MPLPFDNDIVDMPFRKLLNYLTLIPYGLIVTRLGIVLPMRTTPQSIKSIFLDPSFSIEKELYSRDFSRDHKG